MRRFPRSFSPEPWPVRLFTHPPEPAPVRDVLLDLDALLAQWTSRVAWLHSIHAEYAHIKCLRKCIRELEAVIARARAESKGGSHA